MLIKIHRWLGLLLSVIMLTISLTGVLLLWKQEYLWLDLPLARQALESSDQDVAAAIAVIEASYANGEVRLIQLYSNNLALHKVFLEGKRYAWHDQRGNKIQVWQGNQRFEDLILDLHHRFLLGNTIGLNIAGFSGLLVLPLALLGLIIWWPRRRTFKSGVYPAQWRRAAIIRSHGNLGVISIVAIFLTAITGVILVYPEQTRQILLPTVPDNSEKASAAPKLDDLQGIHNATWLRSIERSRALYRNSRVRWVSPPNDDYQFRTIGLQQAHSWNPGGFTTVYISTETGRMNKSTDSMQRPAAQRLFDFSYPLHTGSPGLWYRLLLSAFGLSIAVLCVFGLAAYLRR